MVRPFVTALIDTYNHESFIEDAIQSVLQQGFAASDLEILVVDDGSTDRTPNLVRKFAPRARLLIKKNGGQASAFNAAIPEARGEVIAFLDGDDWWAPGKLTAVMDVLAHEPGVGLVGHGITQIYPDKRQQTESLREPYRFRITSIEEAKKFRMCRGFLGTSRMTYRKAVLRDIGAVPETLRFEADEYLFTLASLRTEVVILREPFTFYRLHDNNLFQVTNGTRERTSAKQTILAFLAQALREKLSADGVPGHIANTIVECVQLEADLLRLAVDGGFPWETIAAERKAMQVFHDDASTWQSLFSYARLVPALVMPAASYYRWRQRLSGLAFYQALRRKFFPFPVPKHVERYERAGSSPKS